MIRVAMLSVHTCPLAVLGGKEAGGMNVYVRELARELGRMGVEVDVFTRSLNPAIPRVVDLAASVRVVHLTAGPEAPLPREQVWTHLDEFADGVERWRAARGLEYDVVHAHYWLSGVVGLALGDRWGLPVLQMFHTLGRVKNRVARSLLEREPPLRLEEEARVVAGVDRIVAANAVERADLVLHYAADPDRIVTIPCGVDTTLFGPGARAEARTALGLGADAVLLYVGRLAPIKGLRTLLSAVAQLRDRGRPLQLLIVGGEADEPPDGHQAKLRREAVALGLAEAVRFTGPQPQERLPAHYAAADATVLPSYHESFGMVALEAMACGSPVIASRVGGLPTTVRDGVTGFLVPDGDVEALAERIEHLLVDPDLGRRLGEAGVRWAGEHRWPCVAEAICREYALLEPRAGVHLTAGRCQ